MSISGWIRAYGGAEYLVRYTFDSRPEAERDPKQAYSGILSWPSILQFPAIPGLRCSEGILRMDGNIRPYQPADDDTIIAVWLAASEIAHPFLTDDFIAREKGRVRDDYLRKAETWVFEHDERVLGFIAVIGNEVGGIFVHPDAQRKGIGKALMDVAVQLRGEVFLDVFKSNWLGRSFYDRYGFSIKFEHIHEETRQPQLRLCYPPHGG